MSCFSSMTNYSVEEQVCFNAVCIQHNKTLGPAAQKSFWICIGHLSKTKYSKVLWLLDNEYWHFRAAKRNPQQHVKPMLLQGSLCVKRQRAETASWGLCGDQLSWCSQRSLLSECFLLVKLYWLKCCPRNDPLTSPSSCILTPISIELTSSCNKNYWFCTPQHGTKLQRQGKGKRTRYKDSISRTLHKPMQSTWELVERKVTVY